MVTQAKRLKTEHEKATIDSLLWNHPVHLIGEKVNDPDLLNCCLLCSLPILVYGRMIPCKHVLCLDCAQKHSSTVCAKCGEKVARIETCQLGTVFVCSFGSPRYSVEGCRRTYLSYRDMEAHIKHRHQKKEAAAPQAISNQQQMPPISQPALSMSNPPPQFLRNSSMIPPPGHMVARPPPNMANIPPGMSSQQHGHPIPSSAVTLQGNIPMTMPPHSIPGNPVVMQNNAGIVSNTMVHPMSGHVLPPHQQMPGQRGPMRPSGHYRPPAVSIRQHNPSSAPSKSHGNLISIPIQGASTDDSFSWRPPTPQSQPWQGPGRGHHMSRQSHYNS